MKISSLDAVVALLGRLPQKSRQIILTICYGLAAGLIGVCFNLTVDYIFDHTVVLFAEKNLKTFVVGSFLVITLTTLISGVLMKVFAPEAAGSGIPQLKIAYWRDFGFVSFKATLAKFAAGILAIGGGGSLGREGPSVFMGGGIASSVSGLLGSPKQRRRRAALAGAAAGLAAAFNTPLASITFVMEEMMEDFDGRILGGVILASVTGAFVTHAIVGKHPAFVLPFITNISWSVYLFAIIVGAMAAVVGIIFQKTTMAVRKRSRKDKALPAWLKPLFGGWTTWILGVLVFVYCGKLGVFGLGYADLTDALSGNMTWVVAGVLLAAKLIATCACYGWEGCGGIFAPTLFLGAMTGTFLGGVFNCFVPIGNEDQMLLTIIGMSACLGTVVRAPITSILIVFEMTQEFTIIPALMLGCLVSQAIGRTFLKHNFYDEILVQDGHQLHQIVPPRDFSNWQKYPLATIARFNPVIIDDFDPKVLKQKIDEHPYNCFPVVMNDKILGAVTRQEIIRSIVENANLEIHPLPICFREQSVKDIQPLLIESYTGAIAILDQPDGKLIGILTLHDILRAQIMITQRSQSD